MRASLFLVAFFLPYTTSVLLEAVWSGVIGLTSYTVSKMDKIEVPTLPGGCEWVGTAPLCRGQCTRDWDPLRRSSEGAVRAQDQLYEALGKPNLDLERRGQRCLPLFGFEKVFCCKVTGDRTWTGYYISALTGHLVFCQYKPDIFDRKVTFLGDFCGKLHCKGSTDVETTVYDIGTRRGKYTDIGTMKCDELYTLNSYPVLKGVVEYGRITWLNNATSKLVDQFYKMPVTFTQN